jgi:hypothetical protein
VPGRTLPIVINGILNGAPRLEMPPFPPPTLLLACEEDDFTISLASEEDDLAFVLLLPLFVFRLARLTSESSYCVYPYTVSKREVKEEDDI